MPEREFESVRLETDISFWDSGAAMMRPGEVEAWRVGLSMVIVGTEGDRDGRTLGFVFTLGF